MTTDNTSNTSESINPSYLKLIRTAVHDLKNPLTVALGNMQLLQMRTQSIEENNKVLISNAIEAIYQQLGILDNIADSVKILDGTLVCFEDSVDIDEILESEIEKYQNLEPKREYQFNRSDNSVKAFVDKRLVTRALSNILEHVKFNTYDGSIILINSRIDLQNKQAVIEIKDDGELLLSENYKSIFEMLSNINLYRKNGRWDNGNLLCFANRIIHFMKGDIVAVDSGQTGAAFVITLPLVKD